MLVELREKFLTFPQTQRMSGPEQIGGRAIETDLLLTRKIGGEGTLI
jgi:hypothetical protein